MNNLIVPQSVLSQTPSTRTSDKYTFIPTTTILEDFKSQGWLPVDYKEVKTRVENRAGFQKHLITLQNDRLTKSTESIPQILLTNSHDGSSALNIHAGIFRLICSNGLVIADTTFNKVRVRHMGYDSHEVRELANSFVETLPNTIGRVGEFQERMLNEDERREFARQAAILRFGEQDSKNVRIGDILQPRRTEDKGDSLWLTYNRIQENIVQGGLSLDPKTVNGRFRKSRKLNEISKNIKINKGLWEMAEELV